MALRAIGSSIVTWRLYQSATTPPTNLMTCQCPRRRRQGQALGNKLLVFRRCPQLIGRLKNWLLHQQNEQKKPQNIDDEHLGWMSVSSCTIMFVDESNGGYVYAMPADQLTILMALCNTYDIQ
jgi:hypothetical protein